MTILHRTSEGSESWSAAGSCTQAEIKYHAIGVSSKQAAINAVLNDRPATYGGLVFTSVRFDGYDAEGNAELSAVYAKSSTSRYENNVGEATVSFDCSGGSVHLTQAYAQRRGLSIGWNGKTGDGMEVAGVDVPVAQMRETYTQIKRLSELTTAYKRRVAACVGKVNNGKFKGWEAGEVMFLGASYNAPDKNSSKVAVTYNFSIQPNEAGAVYGGITIGAKKGWEYVWAITKSLVGVGGSPASVIRAIYIAQVAQYADFGKLGI